MPQVPVTPKFHVSNFPVYHDASRNYNLTVNVPSTSDDYSSETDLSGLSQEGDHFHLMIEKDSDDTSIDDMDYDHCDDMYTRVEFLKEKSNPLQFPP